MTTRDFTANVISASKVVPDGNFKDSKASGVWDINEALDLIKGGNWPNVANINPAAFVDALFSVDVWDGNGSTQTITNNIDLSNKDGLVWIKSRDQGLVNGLFDTVRGKGSSFAYRLLSDDTNAQSELADGLSAFNSNGFALGSSTAVNGNTYEYVGWTFRKQPKFFDVVTWTGTGSAMTIDHNLGQVPGMIIVKSTSATYDWAVWHREFTGTTDYIKLNSTAAKTDSAGVFGNGGTYLTPTSTQFFVGGNNQVSGEVGGGYVAYLFAHNNDDGGFGEPGDQDIIKCDGIDSTSDDIVNVTLGFEPQFIMIKKTSTTGDWQIFDNMRGMPHGSDDQILAWNSSSAESNSNRIKINPDGFTASGFGTNTDYIYMAIRRGGMQTPTAASDVFNVTKTADNASTTAAFDIGFVSDFVIHRETDATAVPYVFTRLLGGQHYLRTDGTNAEADSTVALGYDWTLQNSVENNVDGGDPHIFYNWKRARGYFDVVAYTGTGSATTISHNLGVVPEMMWVKARSHAVNWGVYHKDLSAGQYLILNKTNAVDTNSAYFTTTAPTSSVFSIGVGEYTNQSSSHTYIAYLFATVAGVSKVGSFQGDGGDVTVDCGFTNGCKFILFKDTGSGAHWRVFDSVRGINSGADPMLSLNLTSAQVTTSDVVDPTSSGFTALSTSANVYIFYAIANDPS